MVRVAIDGRLLLVQLLDVDDPFEMAEVLNLYKIPMPRPDPSEAWIGTSYEPRHSGQPRPLLEGVTGGVEADVEASAAAVAEAGAGARHALELYVGRKVLVPADAIPEALLDVPTEGLESLAMGSDGGVALVQGRLERLQDGQPDKPGQMADGECVVAVTSDCEHCCLYKATPWI